jgi:hypothetical protein
MLRSTIGRSCYRNNARQRYLPHSARCVAVVLLSGDGTLATQTAPENAAFLGLSPAISRRRNSTDLDWLGRQDSNLGMAESKS